MLSIKKSVLLSNSILILVALGAFLFNLNHEEKKAILAEPFYATRQIQLEYSHILIISEESPFKNNLVKTISNHLYDKPILFSLIDISELANIDEDFWDKVIIVTSAQNNSLVQEIRSYLNAYKNPENINLVITTDSGRWYGKSQNGIDVITTASKLKDTDKISGEIIKKIDSAVLR